jgi:molybdopterin-containing oxidoreductase family membrane subunit
MKFERALTQTQATSPSRSFGATRWLLAIAIALAATAPAYAASEDTTARPEFAVLIVSFLFLMGVTQAGVVFSAVTRLSGGQWARPYYRLAELSTMTFAPFAFVGFLLIYIFAKDELFYWLNPAPGEHLSAWLNSGWLLARNLFALSLFYGVSAMYVWKSLKPDLEQTDKVDSNEVQRQLYFLSPLVLAAFVICNTFLAWDFAMMLVPHWHSTVFPIHYWFGNVYAGTAALLAIPVVLGRLSTRQSLFGVYQIRSLSMVISGFMLLWLYFLWAQFFVMWFGNLPRETDTLFRQMYGHYGPFYWTMIAGCFFVPFIALVFAVINRSLLAMCVLALGINLAIWINKYLMVIPVFSPDDRLLDHLLDLGLSIGLLLSFIAALVLLARQFPLYCYWEINLKPDTAVAVDRVADTGAIHP